MDQERAAAVTISDASKARQLQWLEIKAKLPLIGKKAIEHPLFLQKQQELSRFRFVQEYIDTTLRSFTEQLFSNQIPYGLFKGTRIGSFHDLQAGIAQKFLGVYEFEIAPYFNEFLAVNSYEFFLDIGAAEGLYAMVFDRFIKQSGSNATVFAFEQDYCTRNLLRNRLNENGATHVQILDQFSLDSIRMIDPKKRGLVLSDCEGFEAQIFTEQHAVTFQNCDLIIETHDNFVSNATDRVMMALDKTHEVIRVDQQPMKNALSLISDPWFNSLSETDRLNMLDGGRHPETRWVVAKSKT